MLVATPNEGAQIIPARVMPIVYCTTNRTYTHAKDRHAVLLREDEGSDGVEILHAGDEWRRLHTTGVPLAPDLVVGEDVHSGEKEDENATPRIYAATQGNRSEA